MTFSSRWSVFDNRITAGYPRFACVISIYPIYDSGDDTNELKVIFKDEAERGKPVRLGITKDGVKFTYTYYKALEDALTFCDEYNEQNLAELSQESQK